MDSIRGLLYTPDVDNGYVPILPGTYLSYEGIKLCVLDYTDGSAFGILIEINAEDNPHFIPNKNYEKVID